MDLFLRNYMDLFPRTSGAADIKIDVSSHVETVCLLSNTQRPKKESYITLDVEMEDYYRIKNEVSTNTFLSLGA